MTQRVPAVMLGLAPSGGDDTAFIQAEMLHGTVFLGAGTFIISNLATANPCRIEGRGRQTILQLAAGSGAGVTLAHAGSSIRGVHIDGNTQGRTGVRVTAADCDVSITASGVNGAVASASDTSVLVVEGNRCTFDVAATNCLNTGHANDSVPRVVTVQTMADHCHGRLVKGDTVNCGVVLGSATGSTVIDTIDLFSATDNGLYQLGGKAAIGSIRCQQYDEAVVASGDLAIGTLEVVGTGGAAIGLENAGNVVVGRLVARGDSSGSPASLARTRAGNVASGSLSILSCVANITPATMMLLSTGTLEQVVFRNAKILDIYNAATPSVSISSWWSWSACKEFDIRDVNVHIVDLNNVLVAADQFTFTLPTTNLAKTSFYENVDVRVTNANGTTISAAGYRGANLAHDMIVAKGAMWRADIGPYALAVTTNNGIRDSIGAIPVVGTWRKGTDLNLYAAAVAPFNTRCTVAGTPGTWVSY